jgi:hypothetical protein
MKLFVIKKEDKYYSQKDKYFSRILYLGTIFKSIKDAEYIVKQDLLKDVFLEEIEEEDFMKSLAAKTTEIVIIADSLAKKLDEIKENLPTNTKVNKMLNQNIKTTSKKLKDAVGGMFKEFENKKEDQTFEVLAYYEEFTSELGKLNMWEVNDIKNLLIAWRKSPKSFNGLVKKIL